MKKIILATAALAAVGFYAWPEQSPNPSPAVVPAPTKIAAPAKNVKPAEKPEKKTRDISTLDESEVVDEISRVDERLEREKWVERANSGQLSTEEFRELADLLDLRTRLYARKVEMADL